MKIVPLGETSILEQKLAGEVPRLYNDGSRPMAHYALTLCIINDFQLHRSSQKRLLNRKIFAGTEIN